MPYRPPPRRHDATDRAGPSATHLCGTLAALAAIFPEKVGQRAERLVVGGVEGELPLAPRCDEPTCDEPIEVVVQGGPGDLELRLEIGRGHAIRAVLNHLAEDRKAGRMTESSELRGTCIQELRHVYI